MVGVDRFRQYIEVRIDLIEGCKADYIVDLILVLAGS